ncbi:hypothetical protein [Streptomyces sp. NBC_01508]|uniref:hypothetical protein n=1 Tax=Streptomyces sp. NBC_01508 TaxID=2903888 RepID=UPI00386986C1
MPDELVAQIQPYCGSFRAARIIRGAGVWTPEKVLSDIVFVLNIGAPWSSCRKSWFSTPAGRAGGARGTGTRLTFSGEHPQQRSPTTAQTAG